MWSPRQTNMKRILNEGGKREKRNQKVKYSLGKTKVAQHPMKSRKKENSQDHHYIHIIWSIGQEM
jgi:hypothetical protein